MGTRVSITALFARLQTSLFDLVSLRTTPQHAALLRVVVGIATLLRVQEGWNILSNILKPDLIPLPYVPGIPLLAAVYIPHLLTVWILAGIFFILGWQTRFMGFVLAGSTAYVILMDQRSYSNHLYLLTLVVLLLTLANCGATFSLDALWRKWCLRAKAKQIETIPYWPLFLLKVQLLAVYGFAGLAKLNFPYLSGQPLLNSLNPFILDLIPKPILQPVVIVLSVAAIATELFIPLALCFPRGRKWALLAGIALHFSIFVLVSQHELLQLQIFALVMLSLYSLFFDLPTMQRDNLVTRS